MSSAIELRKVRDLLKENFFIPSYQRGYRWTPQNVEDLLNDINEFEPQVCNDTNKWYCLQPLVLSKCKEPARTGWFEVVDGQQRLTTTLLLVYYFNEMWLGKKKLLPFNLEYESEKIDKDVFQKLAVSENNKVTINENDIDSYHITRAYQAIHDWVTDMGDEFEYSGFQSKFLHCTQFIWYELEDGNPIETFLRINMGKIPLTNAELIKALLLQKKNFREDESDGIRQIEIAGEWDRIEYRLQDEDFWWFLNKGRNDMPARIEYLLDTICAVHTDDKPDLTKIIGTDKHATFRYFFMKFSKLTSQEDITREWNMIKDYFSAFEEWYERPVWYHYIGFLIFCGYEVRQIYKVYSNTGKEDFTTKLKEMIKNRFAKVDCNISDNIDQDSPKVYNIELEFGNKHKPQIRELLLLYNLQFIVNQFEKIEAKNNSAAYLKFPFKIFKEEKWDVEHIDSFTSNSLNNYNTQKEWIEIALQDIKRIPGEIIDKELDTRINDFVSSHGNNDFNELKLKLTELAGEEVNDEDLKNSIGNLTLLNADINRSYGNALFPSKRRVIIEKDNEGKFIPICTKHVFLKYFDREGISSPVWKKADMINYQNNICETLSCFLNLKKKS